MSIQLDLFAESASAIAAPCPVLAQPSLATPPSCAVSLTADSLQLAWNRFVHYMGFAGYANRIQENGIISRERCLIAANAILGFGSVTSDLTRQEIWDAADSIIDRYDGRPGFVDGTVVIPALERLPKGASAQSLPVSEER